MTEKRQSSALWDKEMLFVLVVMGVVCPALDITPALPVGHDDDTLPWGLWGL